MWMFEGVFGERFSTVDLVLLCVGRLQVSDMQLAGSSFLFFSFLFLFFFTCSVVYISRNPNLCLVARQESSNRDMFSMIKKGGQIYSVCFNTPEFGVFFGSFYICLAWVVVFFFFTPFGFSLYIFKEGGDAVCSPGRRRSRDNTNAAGEPFSSGRRASHVSHPSGATHPAVRRVDFITREQDEMSQWQQLPERRDEG